MFQLKFQRFRCHEEQYRVCERDPINSRIREDIPFMGGRKVWEIVVKSYSEDFMIRIILEVPVLRVLRSSRRSYRGS